MGKSKLMRARKKFGRCCVSGHGCSCEVSKEIQSQPCERAVDRREIRKEILDKGKEEGNG